MNFEESSDLTPLAQAPLIWLVTLLISESALYTSLRSSTGHYLGTKNKLEPQLVQTCSFLIMYLLEIFATRE